MTDALCLELADRGLVTESVTLSLGYSNALKLGHVHGTASLPEAANTYRAIVPHVCEVYDRITDPALPIRRLSLTANNVTQENYVQYSLFSDREETERDRRAQKAALEIKKKFGKNAILRGMDLQEAGTTIERNRQIGGHKSGEFSEELTGDMAEKEPKAGVENENRGENRWKEQENGTE